jgi:hypothetical protein
VLLGPLPEALGPGTPSEAHAPAGPLLTGSRDSVLGFPLSAQSNLAARYGPMRPGVSAGLESERDTVNRRGVPTPIGELSY